ncbi:MAG: alpha/beta fold hydrolase, partial [Bacteroidales bacterium]
MLHYTIHKNKESNPWMTLVHGAGGSSTIWFKQIRRFSRDYNILLVDLRGHGASAKGESRKDSQNYTFKSVSQDVIDVLDHENIPSSHFAGISLGTIIIRQIAEDHPERVLSMVMGGAIMKLTTKSRILIRLGVIFKSMLPYLFLYRFFAFIIMPKKTHREARNLFVREARKLCRKEFLR